MADKLDILSKVMLSLKDDQNQIMLDINALLSKDDEIDIINKVKHKVRKLSEIHSDMEEVQSFITQLMPKELPNKESDDSEKEEKEEKEE